MISWVDETFLVSCSFVALLAVAGYRGWCMLMAWLDQQSVRIKEDIDEAAMKRDAAEFFFLQQEKEQLAFDRRLKETQELAESSIAQMRQKAEERLAFLVAKHQQQWEHKIAHQQHEMEYACYRRAVDWAFAALHLLIQKQPHMTDISPDVRRRVLSTMTGHWQATSSSAMDA